MEVISASQFKAQCLKIIERVYKTGKEIRITKRGRILAKLSPDYIETKSSWKDLENSIVWNCDPFEPVLNDKELDFQS